MGKQKKKLFLGRIADLTKIREPKALLDYLQTEMVPACVSDNCVTLDDVTEDDATRAYIELLKTGFRR